MWESVPFGRDSSFSPPPFAAVIYELSLPKGTLSLMEKLFKLVVPFGRDSSYITAANGSGENALSFLMGIILKTMVYLLEVVIRSGTRQQLL